MRNPSFRFWVDDFVSGTTILSAEEIGAYMLLLCFQWNNGHIPSDPGLIRRIGKLPPDVSLDLLMTKFPAGLDGRLRNARLEIEREKAEEFRAMQSEKGRASAKARFNRGSTVVQPEGNRSSTGGSTETQPPSPSPSPSPIPVPMPSPENTSSPDGLVLSMDELSGSHLKQQKAAEAKKQAETIYQIYPLKVGRPKALPKIEIAIRKFGYEVVKAATERFAKAWEGRTDLVEFCAHPATWYHQERFKDAPETWVRGGKSNGGAFPLQSGAFKQPTTPPKQGKSGTTNEKGEIVW